VRVHYLHGPELSAADAVLLQGMVEREGASISFIEIPADWVAELPVMPQFTSAMWHRIFLPELVPDVDRVLYVDVDTLAADSLEELWRTDMSDHYLAAVTNVFQHNHVHRPSGLGLAGTHVYFNSGVLLMNLAEMRRDGITEALIRFAIENAERLEWPDQDTLNCVLGERRVPLHPRWNCMNSVLGFPSAADVFGREAVDEARARPGIRHFEGPAANKPWHYRCRQPGRELYAVHRHATPWPEWRAEGAPRVRRWLEDAYAGVQALTAMRPA
jgi:lipopolysaccharide biosynthesis glycosyltransferase